MYEAIVVGERSENESSAQTASRGRALFKALAPYADACWLSRWGDNKVLSWGADGLEGELAIADSDAAVILLPADQSFVSCFSNESLAAPMHVRFMLTRAALDAAQRSGEPIAVYLDGNLAWQRSTDALRQTFQNVEDAGEFTELISLSVSDLRSLDMSSPYHTLEIVVGEGFTSRADFRLELSAVEPFGCSRSAAVPPAAASTNSPPARPSDEGEAKAAWYLPLEQAAYGHEEKRIFSQNGEDGVLSALLEELGFASPISQLARGGEGGERGEGGEGGGGGVGGGSMGDRGVYIEIGAGDGSECITRVLREAGWKGVTFDSGFIHFFFVERLTQSLQVQKTYQSTKRRHTSLPRRRD
jgi:hypothetical protein